MELERLQPWLPGDFVVALRMRKYGVGDTAYRLSIMHA